MTLRHLLATAFLAAATGITASAQDRIKLRDGETIRAKVKEVSPKTVTYKRWDNQDGPDFIISKNKIQSIKYANGTQDEIEDADANDGDDRRDRYDRDDRRYRDDRRDDRDRARHSFGLSQEKYGKNIVSLAPIQMANESAAGFGLQYERVIDKKNIISLVLPFAMVFYDNNNGYNRSDTRAYTYFYPGIKIYPTGSNRRLSYGVGVAAALGFGNKDIYVGSSQYSSYRTENVFKAGILVNNSINIQPTKNLYMGLELGLGFTYYNEENRYDNYYYGTFDDGPLVQFSFKIGYRF